jgi:hypothetical protein
MRNGCPGVHRSDTFSGIQFSYTMWLTQANYTVTGPHGFDREGLC